jgi:hypothetical protein
VWVFLHSRVLGLRPLGRWVPGGGIVVAGGFGVSPESFVPGQVLYHDFLGGLLFQSLLLQFLEFVV